MSELIGKLKSIKTYDIWCDEGGCPCADECEDGYYIKAEDLNRIIEGET